MALDVNQIIIGDNVIVMKTFPDSCIDLTVTSPPYDNLRDYKGDTFNFEGVVIELFRITKDGGAVVWIVGDATVNGSETGTSFKQAIYFKEIGFSLHDTMIYQKNGLTFPETNRYYPCWEFMFVFSKGKPAKTNLIADKINICSESKIKGKQRNPDSTLRARSGEINNRTIKEKGIRSNIWTYNTGWGHTYSSEYLKAHPAIFPLKLAEDHILSWSNPGDLVLDPFMGSGTTAIAAIKTKRNFIGIEISEEYCNLANKRIEIEKSQPVLF
jgi:site-specific DNA-methyltransferase (adenine-specific)